MSLKLKVLAIVALIAVLLLGVVQLFTTTGSAPSRSAPPPVELAEGAASEQESAPTAAEQADRGAPESEPAERKRPEPRATVGLSFTGGDGRPLAGEEVMRRYAEAGLPLRVRVVAESYFTGSEITDLIRTRVAPVNQWAGSTAFQLTDTGFQLAEPPAPGRYRLFLGRPGAAPLVSLAFGVGMDGAVDVTVPLPDEVEAVRVRLLDAENGDALAGATVTPYFEFGDDQLFLPGPALTADLDGTVVVPKLEDSAKGKGRQPTWWVETDSHLGAISSWEMRKNQPGLEMKMPIHRSARVKGIAYDSAGQPAAGKTVLWMRKGRVAITTVADDGSFELGPLALGTRGSEDVMLIEDLDAFKFVQGKVKLRAGETTGIVLGRPADGASRAKLHGRITAGEKPIAGAFVITETKGVAGAEGFTRTAADGTYAVDDITPGRVSVTVYFGDPRAVDDFRARSNEPFELAADEERTLDFDLPGGAFRIRVVDERTGQPLGGALAMARPVDRDVGSDRFPGFHYVVGWGLRVGTDGTAMLLAMLPGREHRISAVAEGYEPAELARQIPGTRDLPAEITLRLKRK